MVSTAPHDPTPLARVIAVTSGKGGVGKSNVAANLAIALAQLGRRVTLWDLDFGLANIDTLLNLDVKGDFGDVLRGEKHIDEVTIVGPAKIHVVPGASGDEDLANLGPQERRQLLNAIEHMAHQADYIILDTGAGIATNTIQFTAAADDILIITTPEPTAMLDAYATMKVIYSNSPYSRIHLIMNMARDRREARQALVRMATIAQHFLSGHLLEEGYLLYDHAVGDAVRRRKPFILTAPDCQPARALHVIAHAIDRIRIVHTVRVAENKGFLARLAEHFA